MSSTSPELSTSARATVLLHRAASLRYLDFHVLQGSSPCTPWGSSEVASPELQHWAAHFCGLMGELACGHSPVCWTRPSLAAPAFLLMGCPVRGGSLRVPHGNLDELPLHTVLLSELEGLENPCSGAVSQLPSPPTARSAFYFL